MNRFHFIFHARHEFHPSIDQSNQASSRRRMPNLKFITCYRIYPKEDPRLTAQHLKTNYRSSHPETSYLIAINDSGRPQSRCTKSQNGLIALIIIIARSDRSNFQDQKRERRKEKKTTANHAHVRFSAGLKSISFDPPQNSPGHPTTTIIITHMLQSIPRRNSNFSVTQCGPISFSIFSSSRSLTGYQTSQTKKRKILRYLWPPLFPLRYDDRRRISGRDLTGRVWEIKFRGGKMGD